MNILMRQGIRFHTWLLKRSNGTKANMGGRVLVLKTTGAKSGKVRETPLMYIDHEEGWALAASMAGAPKNPGWFYNLKKNPKVEVLVEEKWQDVTARITKGEERDQLWTQFEKRDDRFVGYQKKTDRVIPVIVLARAS